MERVTIPRLNEDGTNSPAWVPVTCSGQEVRPLIRCKCGLYTNISKHSIDSDGNVNASFFHHYHDYPELGCGWHTFLKLEGWDGKIYKPGNHFPE